MAAAADQLSWSRSPARLWLSRSCAADVGRSQLPGGLQWRGARGGRKNAYVVYLPPDLSQAAVRPSSLLSCSSSSFSSLPRGAGVIGGEEATCRREVSLPFSEA
eukprot:173553-Hanusia_phi.AAC.3